MTTIPHEPATVVRKPSWINARTIWTLATIAVSGWRCWSTPCWGRTSGV
jgi:hypothetical protein